MGQEPFKKPAQTWLDRDWKAVQKKEHLETKRRVWLSQCMGSKLCDLWAVEERWRLEYTWTPISNRRSKKIGETIYALVVSDESQILMQNFIVSYETQIIWWSGYLQCNNQTVTLWMIISFYWFIHLHFSICTSFSSITSDVTLHVHFFFHMSSSFWLTTFFARLFEPQAFYETDRLMSLHVRTFTLEKFSNEKKTSTTLRK